MNIDELKFGEIKQIASLLNGTADAVPKRPFEIGKKYFFRGVLHYTGKLKDVYQEFLVLEDAAWIADTGRFHSFLKNGLQSESEVEPFESDLILPISSIIDFTEWKHELPRQSK